MNFGKFNDGKASQELLPDLTCHETEISNFERLCHRLCIKLLRLFALGLQVSSASGFGVVDGAHRSQIDENHSGVDWFATKHDESRGPSGSILRWLYVRWFLTNRNAYRRTEPSSVSQGAERRL